MGLASSGRLVNWGEVRNTVRQKLKKRGERKEKFFLVSSLIAFYFFHALFFGLRSQLTESLEEARIGYCSPSQVYPFPKH